VAALLAVQLKQQFPNTTCWAFAPPGGLMSPVLAAAVGDFVTSVVTGKDLVPRLSLVTLERLRDDIMTSLARCRCAMLDVDLVCPPLFAG
jgi:sn1-specific diacylglycerol lipase